MNFVFRTDASKEIGTGHVIRCLNLADALKAKGNNVIFICRGHEGNLCDLIEEKGFEVYRLPFPIKNLEFEDDLAHSSWLGASLEEDAEDTKRIIEELNIIPEWLIVDHYALDHRWESKLRPLVKNVFVIDDIADRNHDCDVLLDQNLVVDMQSRYVGKVPESCRLLLGPEYALLQPIYVELHGRIPPREGPVKNILISFGGADNENLTGLALSAFISLNRPDIEADVVISENSQYKNEIEKLMSGYDNIRLHGNLPTLAHLMAKADLAIGASGTTSWERLCLGLPAVVITLAENQTAIAKGLQNAGFVNWLGDKKEVSEGKIRDSLSEKLENGLRKKISIMCKEAVDGKGAERVTSVLTINPETPLIVRHAKPSDEKLLLSWVNDPETRLNSFSSEIITPETHHEWFNRKLRELDECCIYIIETQNSIPIGQVRFEKKENYWEINYLLSPDFRRKGLGKKLLKNALTEMKSEKQEVLILGRVKEDNKRSQKIFDNLNFKKISSGGGGKLSISICSDENSWINEYVPELILDWLSKDFEIRWSHDAVSLPKGNICFYLSYGKIVSSNLLKNHRNNLVVHASDLPKGRGWSPLTWQIIEGKNSIPVTLFEAAESVDSGRIYKKIFINFLGTELIDEMRKAIAKSTVELCSYFVENYPDIADNGIEQKGESTFYSRRKPEDSYIDPNVALNEQFNLLRTVDNDNYPAWFKINDDYFTIKILKSESLNEP